MIHFRYLKAEVDIVDGHAWIIVYISAWSRSSFHSLFIINIIIGKTASVGFRSELMHPPHVLIPNVRNEFRLLWFIVRSTQCTRPSGVLYFSSNQAINHITSHSFTSFLSTNLLVYIIRHQFGMQRFGGFGWGASTGTREEYSQVRT